jgi:hypothetical protein
MRALSRERTQTRSPRSISFREVKQPVTAASDWGDEVDFRVRAYRLDEAATLEDGPVNRHRDVRAQVIVFDDAGSDAWALLLERAEHLPQVRPRNFDLGAVSGEMTQRSRHVHDGHLSAPLGPDASRL